MYDTYYQVTIGLVYLNWPMNCEKMNSNHFASKLHSLWPVHNAPNSTFHVQMRVCDAGSVLHPFGTNMDSDESNIRNGK
ncbi:MAG: hypothetical protein ACJA08_001476 [Cyclobacteriaceae bacterium]|jgi:hypothetical protein